VIAPTAVTTPVGLIERTASKLILPINNEAMFPVIQPGVSSLVNDAKRSLISNEDRWNWRVAFDKLLIFLV
jgi:hypothetical protein